LYNVFVVKCSWGFLILLCWAWKVSVVFFLHDRDSSMVDHQVAGIKTYLTSKFLHASPEWVEGCVEFFVSQHHDKGVS
jgi:hypothetical protein